METQKAIKEWKLVYHPKLRKGVGIWDAKGKKGDRTARWLKEKRYILIAITAVKMV